ncbi:hypothetical protein [Pseudomonas baetica]|uniref:hypothetical protein n=1 Tax=Pseudomonas baetica TaxID=674054 RepID=UPI0024060D03|nr:hypothetical protein [Pseudomonas baetica]MDF9778831.1 hypothetical protein [Pseudomonas baetica]
MISLVDYRPSSNGKYFSVRYVLSTSSGEKRLNDANETALKLARRAEPETRGRLRAWTVRDVDGCPALINLSYIEEGEVAASVIWVDRFRLADLDMVAGHMNTEAGVGDTMMAALISRYSSKAATASMLQAELSTRSGRVSVAIH